MLRALAWIFALGSICAAALFLPIDGKSLWERSRASGKVAAWVKGSTKARQTQRPKRKPAEETLTRDDRVALDALVAGAR